MRLFPQKTVPPTRFRRSLFVVELLEDRSVFSATTSDVIASSFAVASGADAPTQINYTGAIIGVQSSQVIGRSATFFFDDSQVLPGTFTYRPDGIVDISAPRLLDVPESYRVDLRLTSTESPQDSLDSQLRIVTALVPGHTLQGVNAGSIEAITVSISVVQPLAASVTTSPPTSQLPPPGIEKPPVVIEKPPVVIEKPPVAPPPTERPAERVVVVPAVEQAPFVAARTQLAFVATSLFPTPVVKPPVSSIVGDSFVGPFRSSSPKPSPINDFERSGPRQPEEGNPPIVLELAAVRQPKPSAITVEETPFLGVAIEPQEPAAIGDDALIVLTRLSRPLRPNRLATLNTTAKPLEQAEPERPSNRASYLVLATLIGVGTGHYFQRRGEYSMRRDRPSFGNGTRWD